MPGFDISERTVLSMDAESSEESRAGKAMGGFSEQSLRSHRSNGLLYRAHA
jgi:hypothetical protein